VFEKTGVQWCVAGLLKLGVCRPYSLLLVMIFMRAVLRADLTLFDRDRACHTAGQ
jgi:hypothetical protein